jgi:hypothetical protein
MPITPANDARLAELVAALSVAADLGMGQPLEQGLRTCVLALELGRRLGCDTAARSDIYYVALLQHLGCTANAPDMAQWTGGDEIAFRSRAVVLTHASAAESVAALLRLTGADRPPAVRARSWWPRSSRATRASSGWWRCSARRRRGSPRGWG